MGTISTAVTLVPNANIPLGYLDEDNIRFIQEKIATVLAREFSNKILIDRASIIRVMMRILEEKNESIPKMNQRIIMSICNEFRLHNIDTEKHLLWEEGYVESQRLYDPTFNVSRFDPQQTQLRTRFGEQRVGGTLRFFFT